VTDGDGPGRGPVEHLTTSGQFQIDGNSFDVDNNVWILGDSSEVVLFDAPHDAEAIKKVIGDRNVVAILCTHSHNDHVNAAPALSQAFDAPILLNPDDLVVWNLTYPDREPDGTLADGETFTVGGITLRAIATPGHSPGSTCFYAPDLGTLFSGDTLFSGGPGATGPSYSDFDVIIETLRDKIFTLPGDTIVRTGHGDITTIGDEAPRLEEYRERLIETVSENDEEMMDMFLEGRQPTEEQLTESIRRAIVASSVTGVLCGSAFKNKGVQPLLDAVVAYLPSPIDVGATTGLDVRR